MVELSVKKKRPRPVSKKLIEECYSFLVEELAAKSVDYTMQKPLSCKTTTKASRIKTGLLSLPNELLIKIAGHMYPGFKTYDSRTRLLQTGSPARPPKNRDLCHLALTCRRLVDIAQETLVNYSYVHFENVAGLVQFLLKKPNLFASVHGLHLVDYQLATNQERDSIDIDKDVWEQIIVRNYKLPDSTMKKLVEDSRIRPLIALIVLLAELPELRSLKIRDDHPPCRISRPHFLRSSLLPIVWEYTLGLHEEVVNSIKGKLQELRYCEHTKNAFRMGFLSLSAFPNLKRLKLHPYKRLMSNNVVGSDPLNYIPKSLEHLSVEIEDESDYDFNVETLGFLDDLLKNLKTIPSLRTLKVNCNFEERAIVQTVLDFSSTRNEADWVELLKRWISYPVSIQFYVAHTKLRILFNCEDILGKVDEVLFDIGF